MDELPHNMLDIFDKESIQIHDNDLAMFTPRSIQVRLNSIRFIYEILLSSNLIIEM